MLLIYCGEGEGLRGEGRGEREGERQCQKGHMPGGGAVGVTSPPQVVFWCPRPGVVTQVRWREGKGCGKVRVGGEEGKGREKKGRGRWRERCIEVRGGKGKSERTGEGRGERGEEGSSVIGPSHLYSLPGWWESGAGKMSSCCWPTFNFVFVLFLLFLSDNFSCFFISSAGDLLVLECCLVPFILFSTQYYFILSQSNFLLPVIFILFRLLLTFFLLKFCLISFMLFPSYNLFCSICIYSFIFVIFSIEFCLTFFFLLFHLDVFHYCRVLFLVFHVFFLFSQFSSWSWVSPFFESLFSFSWCLAAITSTLNLPSPASLLFLFVLLHCLHG